MRIPQGFYIDSPAWPLLQSGISYWSITDQIGSADGREIFDWLIANEPSYVGHTIKILSGAAAGQERVIAQVDLATGVIRVAKPWTDNAGAVVQVPVGTRFCITKGGGGAVPGPITIPPSVSLWMFGDISVVDVATTIFRIYNLAAFPDDLFNDNFYMQILLNADAPGTAPEGEIRRITNYAGVDGTFVTDAFSANVEVGDLIAVIHESQISIEICGWGTLDTSSVTVPADSGRAALYAWENNDYFRGCLLMPTEGDCRFQPRPILNYTAATGVFTLAEPFSQLPGAVDYVIVRFAYPAAMHITIDQIFDMVNAILTLSESGGIRNTTVINTEYDLYINDNPIGVYKPIKLQIDFSDQLAADTVVIRVKYRIVDGGGMIEKDVNTFIGVQDPLLKNVELEPNRFGIETTIERIAGAAQDYGWAVFFENI